MQVIDARGCDRLDDLGGVLRSSGTDDRYAVGPPKYSSSI